MRLKGEGSKISRAKRIEKIESLLRCSTGLSSADRECVKEILAKLKTEELLGIPEEE